ncbi:MAG: glycosyltransferase [Phototrophicaceae bacterium]
MKLAIVHDWLNQRGGAEDVLEVLVDLYPDSPIYTSMYDKAEMPEAYRAWNIQTLLTDKLPFIYSHHQLYLALYPLIWGTTKLDDYDVIVSNKSGFCHIIQHPEEAVHICYCLTPTRYVWQIESYLEREGFGSALGFAVRPIMRLLRAIDYRGAQRVNHFIAISTAVQKRIKRYYHRDSDIIFPPVDTSRFEPASTHEDYFLCVSRLIPYKRIDLAVQAATRIGAPLKIAGAGRALNRLKELAGPTVEFLGYVPDHQLNDLMARAKAFIFPGLEDFGIAPVQAQAAGRPVIAFGQGGALDTVIPGKTGELFYQQTVETLAQAMLEFDASRYAVSDLRANAERFDQSVFEREITRYIEQAHQAHRAQQPFVWGQSEGAKPE